MRNARDIDGFLDIVADDVIFSDASGAGKQAYGEWASGWFSAFEDVSLEPVHTVIAGDHAAYVIRFTGTHARELKAPDCTSIPATGKVVDFVFADFIGTDVSGKIASDKVIFDIAALAKQLGVDMGAQTQTQH